MDTLTKFISDLLTPYWWLSVVAVSLLTNLASAYLKDPLDRWIGRRSEARRRESEQQRKLRDEWVARIAREPKLLAIEMQSELRYGIASVISAIGFLFVQTASTPRLDSGDFKLALILFKAGLAIAALLLMIQFIRKGDVHYRNVELAKRVILRQE